MATYTAHLLDSDGCDMLGNYEDYETRAHAIGRVVELMEDDEYREAGVTRGEVRNGKDVVWSKSA